MIGMSVWQKTAAEAFSRSYVSDGVRVNIVRGFYSSLILLVSTHVNVLIDKLLMKL